MHRVQGNDATAGADAELGAPPRGARMWICIGIWIAAIAVATLLDAPVSAWVHDRGIDAIVDRAWWAKAIKFGGTFWCVGIVAMALGFWHPLRWKAAGFLALCGIISGVNGIVKWVVGRTRPLKGLAPLQLQPFRDGWAGAFDQKNLCFPSGHACLAFAIAAGLAILLPRWRWAFYAGATLVAIERVAENAHYVSDVVGAAAMGIIGVWIIAAICARVFRSREPTGTEARV